MMASPEQIGIEGELLRHEPMSRHTSWRVGGPAERYFVPASIEDLRKVIHQIARTCIAVRLEHQYDASIGPAALGG